MPAARRDHCPSGRWSRRYLPNDRPCLCPSLQILRDPKGLQHSGPGTFVPTPPAGLHGFHADRVFTRWFAYLPGHKYDTGLMAGKLAMISVSTGTSADTYAPDGIDGAILDILWPIHNGILRYTGFDVLEPFITYMPGKISHDQRRAELGRYADEIRALASRRRLFFHPREHYGPGERLLPNVRPQSGFQHRSCG